MTSACDVILIGAGIMSATLGMLLRQLDPSLRIVTFERLDRAAAESSDAWNNAGTGHAGYCELNYTPAAADGSVDVGKAVTIAGQFGESLAFWRALVADGVLPQTPSFIRRVPHLSFVTGERDVAYLRARVAGLRASPRFADLEHSEDPATLASWMPLVMEGRAAGTPVAATRMARGTDVNFGALTRSMFTWLDEQPGFALRLSHEVVDLRRDGAGWAVDVRDLATGAERTITAGFVFIGAGGYSLGLLEQAGLPEARGYGAFPVSGQWLRCTDRAVIARHHAKVYGQAEVGAPPMSVPHLDTRWIGETQELLFGPYAGMTTKFLKQGSVFDLLGSIGIHNLRAVVSAGLDNLDLTRYLIGQALLVGRRAGRDPAPVLPGRRRRRLGGPGRRAARADHQARRARRRRAQVRHRGRDRRRRHAGRAPGRLTRRVDRGRDHAPGPGPVLPRPLRVDGLADPARRAGRDRLTPAGSRRDEAPRHFGTMTVSITWMTPFEASMSALTTVALSIFTPAEVSIVTSAPLTVLADLSAATSFDITLPGTTW
jgi:malate dehydrogenase (quinone)